MALGASRLQTVPGPRLGGDWGGGWLQRGALSFKAPRITPHLARLTICILNRMRVEALKTGYHFCVMENIL